MEATTKMASNATHYNNLTPAQPLDKATLNKMVLRSLNLQASFNYERMQAAGWLYCILPGLEKIHADNKEDLELSMEHNLEFFNTHPFLVTFVMGIILSLEQQKADIETIRAVRVAAMGPLAVSATQSSGSLWFLSPQVSPRTWPSTVRWLAPSCSC